MHKIALLEDLTGVFEPAEEGGYVCWIEEIPGAMSQGETLRPVYNLF